MNSFQRERCVRLLERLSARPIARTITLEWSDPSGELTLAQVSDDLANSRYASLFDFYLDARLLLEPRDGPGNAILNAVFADLGLWLLPRIENLARSRAEHVYLRVRRLIERVTVIFTAMVAEVGDADRSGDARDSGASIGRANGLQERIARLKTPADLMSVLAILKTHGHARPRSVPLRPVRP